MSWLLNLRAAAAQRRALHRTRQAEPHAKADQKHLVCLSLPKEHESVAKVVKDEPASVPSIHRRAALLGAALPCLCGLCLGGGGGAAKAAGRNPLYDKYFATAMRYGMDDYEAAIRPVKMQLFEELIEALLTYQGAEVATAAEGMAGGEAAAAATTSADGANGITRRVLELGIGTGPNFPFFVSALARAAAQPEGSVQGMGAGPAPPRDEVQGPEAGAGFKKRPRLRRLQIVGLDPNAEMLRFAAESAAAAGLRLSVATAAVDGNGGDGAAGGPSSPAGTSAAAAAEVELVRGSAEALPFSDGEFDAAVVTLMLCSVPSPAAALAELRRVVRPAGRLLLVEHVAAGPGRQGLRLAQGALTPLQQLLADGCCLNRDTAAAVRAAGWRGELREFEVAGLSLLAPHISGVLVR